MSFRLLRVLPIALACAFASTMTSRVSADPAAACGSKENPCPLQKWMRANMGAALAANDLASLAQSLDKIASASPDASWTWTAIAKKGAQAARGGDLKAVKAACKSCHDAYKEPYKATYRTKPAP